jgi:hypothetical protein
LITSSRRQRGEGGLQGRVDAAQQPRHVHLADPEVLPDVGLGNGEPSRLPHQVWPAARFELAAATSS